jgi:hypothetical protein
MGGRRWTPGAEIFFSAASQSEIYNFSLRGDEMKKRGFWDMIF